MLAFHSLYLIMWGVGRNKPGSVLSDMVVGGNPFLGGRAGSFRAWLVFGSTPNLITSCLVDTLIMGFLQCHN